MVIEGTIARLEVGRGYGFITTDDPDDRFFFHRSDLVGARFEALYEGQRVVFERASNPRGPRARAVRTT
jgi:cold shock CspA family protein